jgi:hypothetical protein
MTNQEMQAYRYEQQRKQQEFSQALKQFSERPGVEQPAINVENKTSIPIFFNIPSLQTYQPYLH